MKRRGPTFAHGKICYLEIPTTDVARSISFYETIFGWKARSRGDGTPAFDDAIREVSGAWVTGRPPHTTPGLLLYVMVDKIEVTQKLIEANGGKIVRALKPEELVWYAHFADPDGNVLGLYQQYER